MIIHSRFNPPPSVNLTGFSPTRTQQHFKDECDLNKLIKRAINTGDASVFTSAQRGAYYDCTVFDDYQSAQERLNDVKADFQSLSSEKRKFFGNNMNAYVSFMCDPANLHKAVELGLLEGGESAEMKSPPVAPSNPPGGPSESPSGDGFVPKSDA